MATAEISKRPMIALECGGEATAFFPFSLLGKTRNKERKRRLRRRTPRHGSSNHD
jgi:hypothetical protein